MKKIILSSILVLSLSMFFSSCSQDCYKCTTSGDEESVCKTDFSSTDDYNEAVKKLRALGFTCK